MSIVNTLKLLAGIGGVPEPDPQPIEDEEEYIDGETAAAVPDEPLKKRRFSFSSNGSKENSRATATSTETATRAAAGKAGGTAAKASHSTASGDHSNVLPFTKSGTSQGLSIIHASPDQDIASIVHRVADRLSDQRVVVLNLEYSSKEDARRILDFLGGASYVLRASIKPVAISTYILAPFNCSLDDAERAMEELETSDLL